MMRSSSPISSSKSRWSQLLSGLPVSSFLVHRREKRGARDCKVAHPVAD